MEILIYFIEISSFIEHSRAYLIHVLDYLCLHYIVIDWIVLMCLNIVTLILFDDAPLSHPDMSSRILAQLLILP